MVADTWCGPGTGHWAEGQRKAAGLQGKVLGNSTLMLTAELTSMLVPSGDFTSGMVGMVPAAEFTCSSVFSLELTCFYFGGGGRVCVCGYIRSTTSW